MSFYVYIEMLDLNPDQIFKQYETKKIDKSTCIKQLSSIIEEYDYNDDDRITSLSFLGHVKSGSKKVYDLLENLLVSDSNESIRELAAEIIIKDFLKIAENVLSWVIKNEESFEVLSNILIILIEFDNEISNRLIVLMEEKYSYDYMEKFKQHGIKRRDAVVLKFLEEITHLEVRIYDPYDLDGVFVDIINGEIICLAIYYVRPPKWVFFKLFSNLKKLELVAIGLRNTNWLKTYNSLEELNLSGNDIKDIDGSYLPINLKHLDLSDNEINKINGLEKLKSLEILNLRGNQLNSKNGLKHLSNLKQINMEDNPISDG